MKRVFLIHYHEVNLKRGNRQWFETRLQRHVEKLLSGLPVERVHRFAGRMAVYPRGDGPTAEIRCRLRWLSGVANFAEAREVAADLDVIRDSIAGLIPGRTFKSFKIDTRRGTKNFPLNSQQINEDLGRFVQQLTGAAVRLDDPDLTCHVELVGKRAFLFFERIPGLGGLPQGTGGQVLCLLSGGIDSPVAAFRMLRRGCRIRFVHFHSFPQTTMESQDKVRKILSVLSRYQLESDLDLVPFLDLQREIVAFTPPALRVLLYRRFMMRVAEVLAGRVGAAALVTGDSLGQVASQTLENLRAVSAAVAAPIFRPLIGDDKEDIIRTARQIGTYGISILPDEDCCTMFVPRHPETMASIARLEEAERALDIPRLVESALSATVHETVAPDFAVE
ncbi:MAG: tRNA uracil 4-sulfurtransferase ThiI [Acidobacteriota bacterium]